MDSKNKFFPFDHKPSKNLSDYILDDINEEEIVDDLSFNTKDSQTFSSQDIKICTDPSSDFFMSSELESSSVAPDNILSDTGIDGFDTGVSKIDADLSDAFIGINSTLPKKEIEVLSLDEAKVTHNSLKHNEKINGKRHIKHSRETTNKYVVALVVVGALLMVWYTSFIQSVASNNVQKQLSDNTLNPSNNNNNNNNGNNNGKNNRSNGGSSRYDKQPKESDNGSWDIRFTDMYEKSKIGNAREITPPTYTSTKVLFNVTLSEPGDQITYNLTIKNCGTLNAKVSSIYVLPENNDDDVILFYVSGLEVGDFLDAGKSATLNVTAKYNEYVAGLPNIVKSVSVIVNYIQR